MPKFRTYKLNPETLLYEIKEVSRKTLYARATLVFLGSVLLAVVYFWIYTFVLGYESPKTAILKRNNARWLTRIEVMNRNLDSYDEVLKGLEARNSDVYRSIFGMSQVPAAALGQGYTGPVDPELLSQLSPDSPLTATCARLDGMTREVFAQVKSFDEVATLSRRAGDMASSIPAIPPFVPDRSRYKQSSSFGYRIDPVYGGGENHGGQDFSMKVGNPIYATGDGVVESTNFSFGGYGNEVIIDHGFGYKTRYAHLSLVTVGEGMKVKRGDCIGESGNSGKTTGAHLHYEVIYRGKRVNPMNYLDLDMSVEEYRAMVDKRDSETRETLRQSYRNRKR